MPAVRAAPTFRKPLRLGKHSDGIMAASVHRRAGADYWNEQADDIAERVIRQQGCVARLRSEGRAPDAMVYLRAKRSKSAICEAISSRAESPAERMPWMRSLNSSGFEARARASS